MKYDFDTIIDRKNNFSAKYDEMKIKFGRDDLIPVWIADMDFKTAEPIINALTNRAQQGIYGYTSRPNSYYDAACQWLKKRHEWDVKSEWMLHSPGIVPALGIVVRQFTNPGDKIIIQPPVYFPFYDAVKDNNRELVVNPLKIVDGKYVMDYDDLELKAKSGAKMFILCNPHNPVGRVWTRDELMSLGKICLKYGIKVVSDEIHSDIVLWGNKHTPFAMISEEFCKNSITCISPSKTFNLAGLQASNIIIPNKNERHMFDLELEKLDIKRNNCFSVVATEVAYRYGEEWLEQLLKYIENNIDFINKYCKENIPIIKPNRPEGTYLVWLDCGKLGMSNDELTRFMINEVKVGFDAGYRFGDQGKGYVRMNTACSKLVIEEVLRRLKEAVDKHLLRVAAKTF